MITLISRGNSSPCRTRSVPKPFHGNFNPRYTLDGWLTVRVTRICDACYFNSASVTQYFVLIYTPVLDWSVIHNVELWLSGHRSHSIAILAVVISVSMKQFNLQSPSIQIWKKRCNKPCSPGFLHLNSDRPVVIWLEGILIVPKISA